MKLFINKNSLLEEAQRPKQSVFHKKLDGKKAVPNPFRQRLALNIRQERKKKEILNKKAESVEKNVKIIPPKLGNGFPKIYNIENQKRLEAAKEKANELRNRAETHGKRAGVISSTNSLRHTANERASWLNKKLPESVNKEAIVLPSGGIQHWNDLPQKTRQNIYDKNKAGEFNPSQKVYHNTNEAIRERINTNVEPASYYMSGENNSIIKKSALNTFDPNEGVNDTPTKKHSSHPGASTPYSKMYDSLGNPDIINLEKITTNRRTA